MSLINNFRKTFGWKGILVSFTIICFIITLFWIHYSNLKIADTKKDFLFNNGQFAIGEVNGVNFSGASNGFSLVSNITYFFYFDNQKFENNSLNGNEAKSVSEKSYKEFNSFTRDRKRDRFLVLFEKGNPKNSLMCIDRPIKDSTDFIKYVNEIKKLRGNY